MNVETIRKAFSAASDSRDLERIFRAASKRVHPDVAGGDGTDFIVLTEEFEKALETLRELSRGFSADGALRPECQSEPQTVAPGGNAFSVAAGNAGANGDASFDPVTFIEEAGYSPSSDPRGCLYVSLYRYHSSGIGIRKIRIQPSLRKRNASVLRSVFYWADEYDPGFLRIFANYDAVRLGSLRPTAFHAAVQSARRDIESGFDRFMCYQEEGRKTLGDSARFHLDRALDTISLNGIDEDGLKQFAEWLMRELDKPPCVLRRSK